MGMFMPEDKFYDETQRQTGFRRYTQLLERHWEDWLKLNLLTLLGLVPLALGILLSIISSSVLLLFPLSVLGGAIAGPFLAGLYDNLLRCFRDDTVPWWQSYKKSWKQNLHGSLIPGALLGLMIGLFAFMAMLFWYSSAAPTPGTVLLAAFSALMTTIFIQLYFTQLVLFQQTPALRMRNALLFLIQNFWQMLGVALMQLLYWVLLLLFSPWTLLLLPITGVWYTLFVSELLLYDRLDAAFQIEKRFQNA